MSVAYAPDPDDEFERNELLDAEVEADLGGEQDVEESPEDPKPTAQDLFDFRD